VLVIPARAGSIKQDKHSPDTCGQNVRNLSPKQPAHKAWRHGSSQVEHLQSKLEALSLNSTVTNKEKKERKEEKERKKERERKKEMKEGRKKSSLHFFIPIITLSSSILSQPLTDKVTSSFPCHYQYLLHNLKFNLLHLPHLLLTLCNTTMAPKTL
jgi:hypothetical protein